MVCLQDPELTVWYGPDTYMGSNLAQLFLSLAQLPDEDVKLVHPGVHRCCSLFTERNGFVGLRRTPRHTSSYSCRQQVSKLLFGHYMPVV